MSRLSREFPDSWERRLEQLFEASDTRRKQAREEQTVAEVKTEPGDGKPSPTSQDME